MLKQLLQIILNVFRSRKQLLLENTSNLFQLHKSAGVTAISIFAYDTS